MRNTLNPSLKPFFFMVLFFFCINLNGQNLMDDVIYLKNGSIIRGIVIEQIPNQSIKIQTKDKNVFVFKNDEIEKMTKENSLNVESENLYNFTSSDLKKSGYVNYSEITIFSGIGKIKYATNSSIENSDFSYCFRTVNSYFVSENISLGLGIGIEKFKEVSELPVTFDVRYTITSEKITPVFNTAIGYGVGLSGSEGGLTFNPSFGIKAYITNNVAFLFNIGYKLKTDEWNILYYTNGSYAYTQQETVLMHFISINAGLSF
jgi:hypothetical protein